MLTTTAAELFFVLVRSGDLRILVKRSSQRTAREQHRIDRGLVRSLILETLVFVPVSAALLVLIAPIGVPIDSTPSKIRAIYSILGIVSYGFPFATLRAITIRIAMNTLKEFSSVVAAPGAEDEHG